MVVTGGKGSLAGPIVGGLIFGILPEVLRELASPEVQWIIYGVIMILIVFFLPDGIVPAIQSWWRGRQPSAHDGETPSAGAPQVEAGTAEEGP